MTSTIAFYTGDGTTTDFTVPFDYLAKKFVRVSLGVTILKGGDYGDTSKDYYFLDKTKVRLKVPPQVGEVLTIRRYTSATDRVVSFKDASVLKATDLDVSAVQTIHIAEEARDQIRDALTQNSAGDFDARGKRIINVGDPVDPTDAINFRTYKQHLDDILEAERNTKIYRDLAEEFMNEAETSANKAMDSENKALVSETSASSSAGVAVSAAKKAEDSALIAKESADKLDVIELNYPEFIRTLEEAKKMFTTLDDFQFNILNTASSLHNVVSKREVRDYYKWFTEGIRTLEEAKKMFTTLDDFQFNILNTASSLHNVVSKREVRDYYKWFTEGLRHVKLLSTASVSSSADTEINLRDYYKWFTEGINKINLMADSSYETRKKIENSIRWFDDEIRVKNMLIT